MKHRRLLVLPVIAFSLGLPDVPAGFQPLNRADFDTPENRMGAFQYGRAWEPCMILSLTPKRRSFAFPWPTSARGAPPTSAT